jgi:hypothetical protein
MWYARWYDTPSQWLEDHKNIMYPATIVASIILFCTLGPSVLAQWGTGWIGSYPVRNVIAYHTGLVIWVLAFAGLMFAWALQTDSFFVWGVRPWRLGRSVLALGTSAIGALIVMRIFFRFVPPHSVAGAMYTVGVPAFVLLKLAICASPVIVLVVLNATLLRDYRRR